MSWHLPNALTSRFTRLAVLPAQLRQEFLPTKKRRPRRRPKAKRA